MLSVKFKSLFAGAELLRSKALERLLNVLAAASPGYFSAGVTGCW
jgi:hypothetical protein